MSSLSKNARVAGILYIVFSAFGVVRLLYIPSTLFVNGNATATANNIAAHEALFRFGILSYLIGAAGWIFVTLALYRLFEGVNKNAAKLMVILGSLIPVPIFFLNTVNDAAALLFARGDGFLTAFDKPQRDAFAMLFLRLHHHGDVANEIFWGLWLIPLGYLVYKSRFVPRLLGIWLMAGCAGYLALSLTGLLFPQYDNKAFTYTQPLVISELAFMLWVTIMGAKPNPGEELKTQSHSSGA
jgi:Domain of unknown function (DUF4386)